MLDRSPFDVARYRRDGFAIVRGVVAANELPALRDEVDRLGDALVANPAGWGAEVDWERDHLDPSQRHLAGDAIARIEPLVDLSDAFAGLSRDPRLTAPAEAIFGDEVALFEDKLNLKLPGGAGFPWHQDWSCCWRASTDELVTCFVALDDATEENGPLEVIPGSHRGAICLPFRSDAENMDDPAFAAKTEGFEVDPRVIEPERVVRAPLGAGDMIVFDPYLLHYLRPQPQRPPAADDHLHVSPPPPGSALRVPRDGGAAGRSRRSRAGTPPAGHLGALSPPPLLW